MGSTIRPDFGDISTLQATISEKPYSIPPRLELASAYLAAGYPDLAVGEEYIALLLVDECEGLGGEFEDQALDAASENYLAEDELKGGEERIKAVMANTRLDIYLRLAEHLIACGNLKQASEYLRKVRDVDPSTAAVEEHLMEKIMALLPTDDKSSSPDVWPDWGLVRREVYPWNAYEPDRATTQSLEQLNEQLAIVAPKLEARLVELPDLSREDEHNTGTVRQLGLFAKEDLIPGEQVLTEKSILTATARMNDTFCDACAAKLPTAPLGGEFSEVSPGPVTCPDCMETVFCSQECLDLATELYHPALCDMGLESLAKNPPPKEAPHALYALLLLRTLAFAAHQDRSPLDLPQTRTLWGDFLSRPTPALPFNLHYNVILPLTALEKMDMNIFTESARYNLWTFNTLYAKFRSTADAKMGLDGRPEISAVHPLWCLANHSCAANVRWEWHGHIEFTVRRSDQIVDWRVGTAEDGDSEGERRARGIRKDEQILGHYCDLELDVKERREWAKGALGGSCMCERCVWESENPELVREVRIARS